MRQIDCCAAEFAACAVFGRLKAWSIFRSCGGAGRWDGLYGRAGLRPCQYSYNGGVTEIRVGDLG